MPPTAFAALTLSLLLITPLQSAATTIHRCEDSSGHITFTTLNCSHGQSLSLQNIERPSLFRQDPTPPGGNYQETSGTKVKKQTPTIVGQPDDTCGHLIDARQRRVAIINQRIIRGMSQQDVESALGRPDKINIRDTTTRYRYETKKGRSAEIVFDEKGCVKGKSQTAKSPR
ncbi:cell envelope protein SmpA [Pseudomonas purpurea]|uniref:cell envelope protein SmpA n=1 Tax=Pseudomonas purpurea TaxID=3136737 RepID=UPI00326588EF